MDALSKITPGEVAGSLAVGAFFYFLAWAKTGRRPHSPLAMLLCLGAGTGATLDQGGGGAGSHALGIGLVIAAIAVFVIRDGSAATIDAAEAPVAPTRIERDPPA